MDDALHEVLAVMGRRHWWYRARRTILRAVLTAHLPPTTDRRLLEVGAGTGSVTIVLVEFGAVTAVEPHLAALEVCRSVAASALLLEGTIETLDQLPDVTASPFDVVAAFDVIEHIEDDVDALRRLRPFIADGGRLVLTVPALQVLWGTHDEVNRHFRRYSRSQLNRNLTLAGYRVEYLSYFGTLLLPAFAAVRITRRFFRAHSSQPDFKLPPRLVNDALTRIFSLEAQILTRHRLPIGSSLVAVARPA